MKNQLIIQIAATVILHKISHKEISNVLSDCNPPIHALPATMTPYNIRGSRLKVFRDTSQSRVRRSKQTCRCLESFFSYRASI